MAKGGHSPPLSPAFATLIRHSKPRAFHHRGPPRSVITAPTRKRSTKTAPVEAVENNKTKTKSIKSRLNKKQLDQFRDLLLAKRAELIGDLSALEDQALNASGGNSSHMPIHMADIGSDTYDQDFMLNLAETERKGVREIDAALHRIHEGTYGICQLTGKPIPMARLNAKPWAKYTVEAARLVESGMNA